MKNIIANIPFLKTYINFFIAVIYKLKSNKLLIGYQNYIRKCHFEGFNALGNHIHLENVNLGKGSYISHHSVINKTKIGKFCSIGPNCLIGLGKHPFNEFISSHPLFYSNRKQVGIAFLEKSKFEEFENIEIGNDVWIGAGVIILDGVKIGDGAVIAAGSIVLNDVEPFTLVAGVPATYKKHKFDAEKIKEIQENPWWGKDMEEIKKMIQSSKSE